MSFILLGPIAAASLAEARYILRIALQKNTPVPVENCSFKLCLIAQLMRLNFLKFLYLLEKLVWSNNL